MKRVLLIAVLVLLAVSSGAAELSSDANIIKKVLPEPYEIIKTMAIEEWGTDHAMVLFTINRQCDALIWVIDNFGINGREILGAMGEWTEGGFDVVEAAISSDEGMFNTRTDWAMVQFEAKRQIDAAGKY